MCKRWMNSIAFPVSLLFTVLSVHRRSDSFSNWTRLAPLSTMMWPICRSLSQWERSHNLQTRSSKNLDDFSNHRIALRIYIVFCVQSYSRLIVNSVVWTITNFLLCRLTVIIKHQPRSLLSRNSAARRSTWMLQTFPSIITFVKIKQPRVSNLQWCKRQ